MPTHPNQFGERLCTLGKAEGLAQLLLGKEIVVSRWQRFVTEMLDTVTQQASPPNEDLLISWRSSSGSS